jgi:hypothetical protein
MPGRWTADGWREEADDELVHLLVGRHGTRQVPSQPEAMDILRRAKYRFFNDVEFHARCEVTAVIIQDGERMADRRGPIDIQSAMRLAAAVALVMAEVEGLP